MKKAILIALIAFGMKAGAQTRIEKQADGNFREVATPPKNTGKTLTTKDGDKLPVYVTKSGKYYVIRTSKKTQKQYKQYITTL
jgi:hypothetical protein